MGKDSLIKSTSKKSADEEEKKKTPKKAAAAKKTSARAKSATAKKTTKAKTAGASKAAPKAKKAATKKAAPKAKKTAKKKAAPKTKKAAATKTKKAVKKAAPAKPKKAAAKKKPLTRKELVFKKFEAPKPGKLYTPSQPKETPAAITSPPYFAATDEAELKRLQGIQFRRYSAADLKTAADKAEVDKAAAEKAPTEKAAAEKAAAEQAAAERAAAKIAAAEKAAAEAEVREKVEAEVEVGVSYVQPPATPAPADPVAKMFKYGIAGFAAIILLLIATSMTNTVNYYLKAENGSLEIWQGRFAPMGQDRLIVLSGMEAPEPIKEVYSKNDVYPLVFNFYVAKADELLAMPGMPDYEGIRDYLHKAQEYAATPELRSAVYSRLDSIEFMTLMIKTNVAVQKRTVESLEEALGYLRETRALELDEEQAALVASKTAAVQKMIDELKAQEAAEAEAADGK